mgnify:CR=1 FL=1
MIVSNLASPLGGAWGTHTVYDTKNKTALGIAMSCEDYGLLYPPDGAQQSPQLRVNAQSNSRRGSGRATRSVRSSRARRSRTRYVMLSAHFDSWDGSQGATDNGTGTIAMMEAMRILETGVSAAEADDHRRALAGRRAGAERLAGVRVRSSRRS